MINLWKHQKECVEEKKQYDKCLINCWCGTGKTRIFTYCIFEEKFDLSVIVFPSLGLINQYNLDYVNSQEFKDIWNDFKILSFCSEDDGKLNDKFKNKNIKYTTSGRTLKTFLKNENSKVITVTYQSFENFVDIIKNLNISIDYLIYDEAHHTVGSKIQEVVYNDEEFNELVEKIEFYTATPINRNGITMYDKDEPENSDCGPIAYEYLYYQALEDGISRKYDVILDLSVKKDIVKDKYEEVFETIIRNCLSGEYDYWNILTFHSGVNESEKHNNSVVKEFCNQSNISLFRKLFTEIQNKDFPYTKNKFNKKDIIFKGIHSDTKKRDEILNNFDRKVKGRIFILSSCRTIGEGIDTKWANMQVPVDPSKSLVYETQKIGRITRKPENNMYNSNIVLPVAVDRKKYSKAITQEQRDELIRKELEEGGDFNMFFNIVSAFKYQYDPEIYELCLKYPNMYSPDEVKNSLKMQGFETFDNQGSITDNINFLLEDEYDFEDCIEEDDKETIENIANGLDIPILVHTQNYNIPIEKYNEESEKEPIHLFLDENGDYFPVKAKDKKDRKKSINPPKKRDKLFKVKANEEFQIMWDIDEDSLINFENGFGRGTLDCEIKWNVRNWFIKYKLLEEYVKKNGFPKTITIYKNIKIGYWCVIQRRNKRNNKLDEYKISKLEKIMGWFWDKNIDIHWDKKYKILKEYVDNYGYIKHSTIYKKIKIGNWFNTQKLNKKKGKLTIQQINKLKKIEEKSWWKKTWEEHYIIFKEYIEKKKILPKSTEKYKEKYIGR